MEQPNWGDYTSIHNWLWKVRTEYYLKHTRLPDTAHLPLKIWERVRQNHFISVGNYFFGLAVKTHESGDNAWVSNSHYDHQ